MRSLPVEIAPERVEFEIKVLPPEPDEVISAAEEMHAYQEQAARQAAWTYFMQTCTGVYLPLPDLGSWPERYARAFREELARLKADRAGPAEGGPS